MYFHVFDVEKLMCRGTYKRCMEDFFSSYLPVHAHECKHMTTCTHNHIRIYAHTHEGMYSYEDQAMLIQSHCIYVALQGQFSHHNDPIISKLIIKCNRISGFQCTFSANVPQFLCVFKPSPLPKKCHVSILEHCTCA